MIFLTRHEMMSVTFTDGSKSAEKKRKKNPPTPRQAVVAGCGGGGGVGSHVWMSHHTVKCEHTFADATKFQFNTSNYTSLMEKTTVTMAQRRGRWSRDDIWPCQNCGFTSHRYIFKLTEEERLWEGRGSRRFPPKKQRLNKMHLNKMWILDHLKPTHWI